MIDYQHNILSITSMILKKYGKESIYPPVDLDLTPYKKIVLILMDGMGIYNMDQTDYLYPYIYTTLSTVFPTTTVAATTAIRTGKSPLENGWVGWRQYFKEYDANYVMFLNYDYYTRVKSEKTIDEIMDYHSFYEYLPVPAYEIFPAFRTKGMKTFKNQIDYCNQILKENEECMIYIYQDEYDSIMHRHGIHSHQAISYREYINQTIQDLKLDEDTIVLLTADHGHIDVENICLKSYPDIMDCLERLPTIEDRAVNFKIKEDQKEVFERLFNQYFGKYFKLLSHEEVFQNHLLGYGQEHERIHDFINDYLAIATDRYTLSLHEVYPNIGQHAGYTKEEIEIPLIVLKK